jgi:transaldolase
MFFLDSSEPHEIADIQEWGVISGVTTNPLILAREGAGDDLEARIRAVLAVSTGHVSVELTTESAGAMQEEAARYHAWDRERICIKVPFTEPGLKVLSALAKRGVPTNATCLMSFNQAYLAALAGATYVSIFSGRVRDMGYDVRPTIAQTRAQLDSERLASKIIVGSVRHVMDVNESLSAGAHIVTVPPKILRSMLRNPRTDETIREFNDAWAARGEGRSSGGGG